MLIFYVPVGDDVVPSFFLPPRFVRVPCSFWNILPVASLFHYYVLPLLPFLCVQPTLLQCLIPPIVRPQLSVRRRATNPPALADQCPLLVSRPSVPYAGLYPPPTPKPSTTSRTGRGGVQTCIWDAGSGNQKRALVGRSQRVGSSPTDGQWGTDDGGGGIRHWRRVG